MRFLNIHGHEKIKERLKKSVQENRVSHAQLFAGPEGNGALLLAVAYAQYILCSNKTENDSCGTCSSCMKIKNLAHPDLHFSFPFVLAEADTSDEVVKQFRECFLQSPHLNLREWNSFHAEANKQPQIGVKEASAIMNKLSLKSYEGGYKIMIVWLAEYMNAATSNKLLKILEEPPDQTLFILVSENTEQLLPTILSRTQLIKIPAFSEKEIIEILTTVYGANAETASVVAGVCEGNMTTALNLLTESDDPTGNLALFRRWMQICYKNDLAGMTNWVDEIAEEGRENQKNFLYYGLQLYRQCVLFHYSNGELVNLIGNERKFIENFSPFVMGHNISQIHEAFNKAHYHLERNGNPKLIFFNLSVRMMRLLRATYLQTQA